MPLNEAKILNGIVCLGATSYQSSLVIVLEHVIPKGLLPLRLTRDPVEVDRG